MEEVDLRAVRPFENGIAVPCEPEGEISAASGPSSSKLSGMEAGRVDEDKERCPLEM